MSSLAVVGLFIVATASLVHLVLRKLDGHAMRNRDTAIAGLMTVTGVMAMGFVGFAAFLVAGVFAVVGFERC